MGAKDISVETVKKLVRESSADDFVGLLKEFGDDPITNQYGRKVGDSIDEIAAAVNSVFCKQKAKKRALLADYLGKQGVFDLKQGLPADKAADLQRKIDVLTETVRELTEKVSKTDELRQEAQALTQRVAALEENEKTLREIIETLLKPEDAHETEQPPAQRGYARHNRL